jgi:N utilization substance protein B
MFQKEIPSTIVIDEAIGICKEFGTDESFKFINGVLDSICKTLQGKQKKTYETKQ